MHCIALTLATLSVIAFDQPADRTVVLEQIISREHPSFNPAAARLAVGHDGRVYLASNGPDNTAYVIRTTREGGDKFGGPVTYALANATANRDGTLATANGHFAHKVALYDRTFTQVAESSDFLVGDHVGYDAPAHVAAGSSGDFYGLDKHRNRIVRISPQGKVLQAYPIPREPDGHAGLVDFFLVSEKRQAFYLGVRQGPMRVVGFDGQTRWSTPHRVGMSHLGMHGGCDLDADGNLYVIQPRSNMVVKVNAQGEPAGEIALHIPEFSPSHESLEGTVTGLQVAGDELLLKRGDATRLFERFDRHSGTFHGSVASDHERLRVSYASGVWTAGESIAFRVDFHSARGSVRPQWRVWIRPVHHADYRELSLEDGKLIVPADLGGMYQMKVTPEVEPWERGEASEYIVRGWVEVRQPAAIGSLSIITPRNRVHFGCGEPIPISVLARAKQPAPVEVTVELTASGRKLAATAATITPGKVFPLALPADFTRALGTGEYQLVASAANFTSVAQTIVIGPGTSASSFLRMRHGDYGPTYPSATAWNAPDVVAAHVARERRLGFNMFVDRIGTHIQIGAVGWDNQSQSQWSKLLKRLQDDPAAVAPETVETVSPLLQVMAAYGAFDMKQMAILLYMDAGLPLGGPGFDNRKPEELAEDLQTVTQALSAYPAFRGWSWHSNWWIYEQRGAAAARTPDERAAYDAAVKRARDTGEWSAVLDEVSERRLNFAVEAQEFFKNAMHRVAPGDRLTTASAGTYRNVEAYPPISFQNVDEVDLQGQFEQIFPPYFPPHAVDFYRRPHKPVWGHPEIWNDDGTGGQILPELLSMLMRSPDGLGPSGSVPPWTDKAGIVEDPRIAHFGTASIFRAINRLFERYGAWIRSLDTDDRVAIVASARQFKIDEWGRVTGIHFARLFEAYASCLHAHHPATIVFVDDLKPDTLKQFRAVLVVDQWVEMEPELQTALENARAAGVRVLYDGTCRASLVNDFTPLGISFDKFEKDRHPASDDAAYYRFPDYVRQNVPELKKALDAVTEPAAKVAHPEVWVSRLKSHDAHYVFVVNNTSVPLEPSQMWRTSLHVASLSPVVEPVGLTGPAPAIYDVFAMKQIAPQDGVVTADLRSLPARLYALLPAAIDSVALRGPDRVLAGQPFRWTAEVRDAAGERIESSLPLRVRMLSGDGRVLVEQFTVAQPAGTAGDLVAPLSIATRSVSEGPLSPHLLLLEVTELISGRSARLEIPVAAAAMPLDLLSLPKPMAAAEAVAVGAPIDPAIEPTELDFGPHLRDMALSHDGTTALINAMNWDQNLYGVNTTSGDVVWRRKVGNYFAFAPRAYDGGFGVQGFDYDSAEGYHLYLMDRGGAVGRRFALYGLPRRLPHRFVPGLINDRANPVNNFTMPSDGRWIAAAGDLGLAVWDHAGSLLWKRDWWGHDRRPGRLASAGQDTLLVAQGMTLTAHDARDGGVHWTRTLAATGTVRRIAVSRDGHTAAVLATSDGGRVFLLRGGELVRTLIADGEDIDLSADGSTLVTVAANQLKYYTVDDALNWSFAGDDRLRNPRLSPDASRIAVASELGTVYVLDASGKLLYEHDNGALTVPGWLPDRDLLLANWMGTVRRLDDKFVDKWHVRLQPGSNVGGSLTARDEVATARVTGWGNAAAEPLPLVPNLLADTKAIIKFVAEGSGHIQLARTPEALVDGSAEPPAEPWLEWGDINWFAEMNPSTYLQLDAFRTQMRVDAISFYEDPSRPDAWLRDAALEYWDARQERWLHVQPLLSDRAIHTHRLKAPVEAARFRLVIPRGFYGNLRLAEIVLHGKSLGASHPDVIARRPVAVLFDDSEEFKGIYPYHDRWSVQLQGAYSGGRFLQVNADQYIAPTFYPTFGHAVPNWDFEIAEHPEPGQYRWAQWSWKALSPGVAGATVQLGNVRLHAGRSSGEAHLPAHAVAESVPGEWRTVRVDLWQLLRKPQRIQTMYLGAVAGAVGFDQIVLARSEADLDALIRP